MELSFNNLMKKGMGALLVQGLSMVILFVLNWFLAQRLGAIDYGVFTYAMSWVYLFGTLSMLGLNTVIQREVIKYAPNKIRRLISYSRRINYAVTIATIVVFTVIVYFMLPNLEETIFTPLLLAIMALPVFGQLLLNKSVCIGLKKVILSQLPEEIIRPLLTLIGCVILWQFISPSVASGLLVIMSAIFIAFLISILFAHKAIPKANKEKDNSDNQAWMRLGLSFFVLTAAVTINSRADILMLGFFDRTDQVGIYNIATKLSALIGMGLLLINKVLIPYISKHIHTDKIQLNLIIKKFMRIIFIIGLGIASVYYFLGYDILHVFGKEFTNGYWALIILCAGQLANVFVGPVGNLLTMSNYEKISVNIMIISTLINVILNLSLIPAYGMEGAAIGTTFSLLAWNIIHYIYVRKKLNINPSIL